MALTQKLEMRQGQALVMTPQLQQAIKLLQLSNMELDNFVAGELETNPLLERRREDDGERTGDGAPENAAPEDASTTSQAGDEPGSQGADEWLQDGAGAADPASVLDTDYENVDPESDRQNIPSDHKMSWEAPIGSGSAAVGEGVNLEAFVSSDLSLRDHLVKQLKMMYVEPVHELIGEHLIDMIDESGYVRGDITRLAERLGVELSVVETVLQMMQTMEPSGVFARDLRECLKIQLINKDRYDPQMALALENIELLASHRLPELKRICSADNEDLADIISEIKHLNPKPGLQFGSVMVQPVIPDVIVKQRADGSWHVELNSETLPRVLVNQIYYTSVTSSSATKDTEKSYINECLQNANWLVKSLDQRARTILKVAQEIVRQQDGFLTYGVQHLRPLNLKTVADAISMHESTVSRVTSNKYMETNRGIFELKYFFTSSINSSDAGEDYSSEAVKYRIKKLIEGETASSVLSDDKIVDKLSILGIDIARRTVAKYRESMDIPSSVQRRRQKKLIELETY